MSLKVLLVDDDEIAVFLQKMIIIKSKLAKEVHTFFNGIEALEYLNQSGEQNEFLILLDINMPVMNGWQLLNEINKMDYAGRVYVALAAHHSNLADLQAARQYPQIVNIFEKPVSTNMCESLMKLPHIKKYF